MDKKRTIKICLAVCFTMVCGTLYLVFASPFGKQDGLVFEKHSSAGKEEETRNSVFQEQEEYADSDSDVGNASKNETMLYVHVCGAVCAEGVYALPVGSRVTDAIDAAGGFRQDADVTFHNLAALLADGQKVYVPTAEETKALSLSERTDGTESSLSGAAGMYRNGSGKKVNLNTAGLSELMTLNGIGEAKAESIIKYREKVGRFQSIEELKKVSGIGEAMFERIRDDIVAE